MIPRTSIEEANKHLQQLHQRLHQLENTVQEQQETLSSRDMQFKQEILHLTEEKEREADALTSKLLASERTVSVLQEELERKNQQIVTLQQSQAKLRRLLHFKDDLHDLLKTMADAEDFLPLEEGDTDGLLSFYQRGKDANLTQAVQNIMAQSAHSTAGSKKTKKKRSSRSEASHGNLVLENGTLTLSDGEAAATHTLGGKEFYL